MTLKTQLISVDYKTITGEVYANAKMRVTLLTAVALDSPGIAPTMEFDFTANALGIGEFEIVVPTSGGFSFSFRLPDFNVYTAVVGYTGVTAVPLADILASNYTPPDEAVLTEYVRHDGTTAMTDELLLSGNPVEVLGATPRQYVDTVQTNLDTHESDLANPHQVTAVQTGADLTGSAAAAQAAAIQRTNHTGTQLLSTISDAGTAAASAVTDFVAVTGDDITGGLTIAVPTTTENALILQTTDDNSTKNVLEIQDSAAAVVMSVGAAGGSEWTGKIRSTRTGTGGEIPFCHHARGGEVGNLNGERDYPPPVHRRRIRCRRRINRIDDVVFLARTME